MYKSFVSTPKYSIEDMVIYGRLENVDGPSHMKPKIPKALNRLLLKQWKTISIRVGNWAFPVGRNTLNLILQGHLKSWIRFDS